MADCIFCKIVAGEIPSHQIYADEHTLAFMDAGSVNPGHLLVVVKDHYATMMELPEELAAAAFRTANRVVKQIQDKLNPEGLTILQANNPAGWQTVPHFHMHVLPRHEGDGPDLTWPARNPPQEELARMAETLKIS